MERLELGPNEMTMLMRDIEKLTIAAVSDLFPVRIVIYHIVGDVEYLSVRIAYLDRGAELNVTVQHVTAPGRKADVANLLRNWLIEDMKSWGAGERALALYLTGKPEGPVTMVDFKLRTRPFVSIPDDATSSSREADIMYCQTGAGMVMWAYDDASGLYIIKEGEGNAVRYIQAH